ncbi:hypothetical protein [Streptomyces sp. AC550_RSS872]|uniref:hypothetical protein n=1 Tax=Streptomyces sp. AC550_RSS872 TaxID=2823689 RepID=UPI0020B703B3|nr:hypothetical protein [Streptomyces sp. AC550_RSS872]
MGCSVVPGATGRDIWLSSVKAWTGYHALRAARARAAGREDAAEAQYAEVIACDTRAEFDSALAGATSLVDALARELRVIAELPGADALQPPAPPLNAPGVVCAPRSLELEPYLRVLRWFLDDGETYGASASPTSSMPSVPFPRSSAERRTSWRRPSTRPR